MVPRIHAGWRGGFASLAYLTYTELDLGGGAVMLRPAERGCGVAPCKAQLQRPAGVERPVHALMWGRNRYDSIAWIGFRTPRPQKSCR